MCDLCAMCPHGIHPCVWGAHGAMGELKSPQHSNDDRESSQMCQRLFFLSHPPAQGEDTHTMTYAKCRSAGRAHQRTPSTAHASAAAHTNCGSSHKVQQNTQSAAACAKCNSAQKVQQHAQSAAAHAKCSSTRNVQQRMQSKVQQRKQSAAAHARHRWLPFECDHDCISSRQFGLCIGLRLREVYMVRAVGRYLSPA